MIAKVQEPIVSPTRACSARVLVLCFDAIKKGFTDIYGFIIGNTN